MKAISVAVLVAVLAAGLMAGCATAQTTTAALPYQPTQGSLGLKGQDDPEYSMGNPFRLLALVLYPAGLFLQRVVEVPYAVAMRVDPTLFGINEVEQQYLHERWGVRPGPSPDAPPAQPAPR